MGSYYKLPDGTRTQVIGIAENESMAASPKIHCRRCFSPSCNCPQLDWLVVRSKRDPQQLGQP